MISKTYIHIDIYAKVYIFSVILPLENKSMISNRWENKEKWYGGQKEKKMEEKEVEDGAEARGLEEP